MVSGVNFVKGATVIATGTGAASAVFAATAATTTAATIAFSALALTFSALGIASMTAAFDPRANTVGNYFNILKDHAFYVGAGLAQFVGQTFVNALVQGAARGVETRATEWVIGRQDRRYA